MSGRRKELEAEAEALAGACAFQATRRGADRRCVTGRKRLKSVDEVLVPVRALARELSVCAPQR